MDRDELIHTIMELYEKMNEEQRAKAIGKILDRLQQTPEIDENERN